MLQVCFKHASNMLQVCLWHTSGMLLACFKYASPKYGTYLLSLITGGGDVGDPGLNGSPSIRPGSAAGGRW